jgi:hypothetical protein
LKELSL